MARKELTEFGERHVLGDKAFPAASKAVRRRVRNHMPLLGDRFDIAATAALLARHLHGDRQLRMRVLTSIHSPQSSPARPREATERRGFPAKACPDRLKRRRLVPIRKSRTPLKRAGLLLAGPPD